MKPKKEYERLKKLLAEKDQEAQMLSETYKKMTGIDPMKLASDYSASGISLGRSPSLLGIPRSRSTASLFSGPQ